MQVFQKRKGQKFSKFVAFFEFFLWESYSNLEYEVTPRIEWPK